MGSGPDSTETPILLTVIQAEGARGSTGVPSYLIPPTFKYVISTSLHDQLCREGSFREVRELPPVTQTSSPQYAAASGPGL